MEKMFVFDFGIYYVNNFLGKKSSVLMGIFLWLCSLSLSRPRTEHRHPEMTQAMHDTMGSTLLEQFSFHKAA